ncbi:unnamed protein product, partial [Meganyctiphanes norvegica]
VNNVGVSGPLHTLFCDLEEAPMWDIMNVNVGNVPVVTKIVLPGMLQRKRGVIVNLCDITSIAPFPTMAVYSASKAFVNFFTQALSAECEGTGVMIQSVHPGPVHSNMSKPYNDHTDFGKLPSFMFPTADVFVESALDTVGHTDFTNGYWSHSLQRVMLNFLTALPFRAGIKLSLKQGIQMREEINKNKKMD